MLLYEYRVPVGSARVNSFFKLHDSRDTGGQFWNTSMSERRSTEELDVAIFALGSWVLQ